MMKNHTQQFLAGILLAALFLGGCGKPAEPKSFGSLDGLTVAATQDWAPVEDKQSLFEEDLDPAASSGIDLALADKNGHYFSIERYDCQEQLEDLRRLAAELRQQVALQGEEGLVQNLQAQGIDEETLSQYRTLWQCPEGEEEGLYRTLSDAAWQKQMAAAAEDYIILGQEALTLLESETTLYEYRYTNGDKKAVHGYEASVIWQGKFYNISAWTSEKQFAKSQEELKSMIQSVVSAAQ